MHTTETLQHRDTEIRDLHDQLAAGCACPTSTTTDAAHGTAWSTAPEQPPGCWSTELDRHRTGVPSEVAERVAALETEVTRLKQVDHDHRDRMRSYLTQQLAQIEPTAAD